MSGTSVLGSFVVSITGVLDYVRTRLVLLIQPVFLAIHPVFAF